jgi:uncharacterized protein YggE
MRRFALVVAGFLAGAVIALQVPSTAQQEGGGDVTRRTITVTGTSTITAKPDEAVVSLGVQTQATKAQDAMQQNATKMSSVIKALKDLGIGDADLATTNLSLDPRWDRDGTTVVAFQARNQVDVTLHDLDAVGETIDAAVAAGANLAGGITFGLSDRNQGLMRALADAVENARTKADAMAAASGANVGQVVTVTETSSGPQPYMDRMAYPMAAEASTPVNPPTIESQVQVSVAWELT